MPRDHNQSSTPVDLYISRFNPEIQERLLKVREIIRKAAPGAEETISYQMPTYRLNGNLVHFAAFNNHIGFYPTPSGIDAFKGELAEFKGAKGSIQFPHSKPLPYDLILRIIKFRVAENSKADAQKGSKQSLKYEAVKKASGKGWIEWFDLLDEEKAGDLSHAEIVQFLEARHNVPGWWAQSIAVEYERYLGRRQVGQVKDSTFQTAVSKTLPGGLDQVFKLWLNSVQGLKEFNFIPLAGKPATSKSEKWRYWRVDLMDGSKVTITVGTKSADKSILTFSNERLKNQDAIEPWKVFWKNYINNL